MATPVAVFGQNPQVATAVAENMKPECDTVHICIALKDALAELPVLFAGEAVTPASKLGTNVGAETQQTPKYLIFGAGLPAEEVKQVSDAVKAKSEAAKFIQVNKSEIVAAGGSGPDPKVVGHVLKAKIAEMEKTA